MERMGNPGSFRRLLRNVRFRSFLGMSLATRTAGAVTSVCVIWWVFVVTGSPIAVAFVGIVESAATALTTLPAGTWVDRYDRRLLLVVASLLMASGVALLAVLSAWVPFSLVVLLSAVALWSAAAEIYRPSMHSTLPDLVESELLVDANGVERSTRSVLGFTSNGLAGVLIVTVGVGAGFVYGTVGYVVAAAFALVLLLGSRRETPPPKPSHTGHTPSGLPA